MRYVVPPSVPLALFLGAALTCDGLLTRAGAQALQRPSTASHVTPAADTVTLSYVCGNHFRVTHTSASLPDTTLGWTTPSGDRGTVSLYRKLPGRAYTEGVFHTVATDSVYITGFSGMLREANGALPDCTPARDTTWPTVNSGSAMRQHVDTSLFLVDRANPDTIFGHAAYAQPNRGFSRDTIAKYLAQFDIRVSAAITSGLLILRVDGVHADFATYTSLPDSLEASPPFAFVNVVWLRDNFRTTMDARAPRGRKPL